MTGKHENGHKARFHHPAPLEGPPESWEGERDGGNVLSRFILLLTMSLLIINSINIPDFGSALPVAAFGG